MKNVRYLVVALFMLMLIPAFVSAEELFIPAPTSGDDFLNDHIYGDTTATGERADLDRVYVLERGGMYFLNERLVNDGWALRIKSQEGEGKRAVIYMITNTTTASFPSEMSRMREDLWLKDLIIVGFFESEDPNINDIGNIPGGIFRSDAPGFDVVIDNCLITQTRGQILRTQYATRVVKITNSIFANMGDLGRSNFGAGKGVDFRDTSCDSAIFVNNTFVNFQDRVIRHRSSTASIKNLIFDHNTLVNGMSYHGTLALGWVGDKVDITNNLFVDTFIAGEDSDAVRQSEFDESGELDEYGGGKMTWILSVPNDTTEWAVSGNYYSVSDAVQAFYDAHANDPGFKGEGAALTDHIVGKLGDAASSAFVKELVTLGDRPEPMIAMAEWYRSPNGGNKTKATTNFNRETDDFDRKPYQYFDETFDCSFTTDLNAYTGAAGFPAGDLNWFPEKKQEWEDQSTGVANNRDQVPSAFELAQNYPNPFNPTTSISYTLPNTAKVTLTVYNTIGQKVAELVDGQQNAGRHQVSWDGRDLTGRVATTGVYFYQLKADDLTMTRKMLLVK